MKKVRKRFTKRVTEDNVKAIMVKEPDGSIDTFLEGESMYAALDRLAYYEDFIMKFLTSSNSKLIKRVTEDGVKAVIVKESKGDDWQTFLEGEPMYDVFDRLAKYEYAFKNFMQHYLEEEC